MSSHNARAVGLVVATIALATAAACSGPAPSARSSFRPSAQATCMHHQPSPPAAADRSPQQDVAQRLIVLRYYTAHGDQPFCDGRPATADDLSWMRLFIAQGAQRSLVSRWVGA